MNKDCNFQNVSAEEYRLDLVLDTFINDLESFHMRPRLLESNEFTENEGFNKTRSLHHAEVYSATYTTRDDQIMLLLLKKKVMVRILRHLMTYGQQHLLAVKNAIFMDLTGLVDFGARKATSTLAQAKNCA